MAASAGHRGSEGGNDMRYLRLEPAIAPGIANQVQVKERRRQLGNGAGD